MQVEWATSAHHLLIQDAFPDLSLPCKTQMEDGSDDVDRFENQLLPGHAYQHAMRDLGQSIEEARTQMFQFISGHYESARSEHLHGDENRACFERGQALHPVMDSTSPAHEGFQVWDPLHDPFEIFRHGDLPGSVEDLHSLQLDPSREQRTVQLMISIDQSGMQDTIDWNSYLTSF